MMIEDKINKLATAINNFEQFFKHFKFFLMANRIEYLENEIKKNTELISAIATYASAGRCCTLCDLFPTDCKCFKRETFLEHMKRKGNAEKEDEL